MATFTWPILNSSTVPSAVQIRVDGVLEDISVDTVTPANSRPMPVELYAASGQINITAGDINVQLSDQGVNYDITRIGDGTNQLEMTGDNEAKVSDADALLALQDIYNRMPVPFINAAYDTIEISYVTVGNGIGQIETVEYKAGAVTQQTLTFSYDANDQLVSVVRT